jgi:hypothetical protein
LKTNAENEVLKEEINSQTTEIERLRQELGQLTGTSVVSGPAGEENMQYKLATAESELSKLTEQLKAKTLLY